MKVATAIEAGDSKPEKKKELECKQKVSDWKVFFCEAVRMVIVIVMMIILFCVLYRVYSVKDIG